MQQQDLISKLSEFNSTEHFIDDSKKTLKILEDEKLTHEEIIKQISKVKFIFNLFKLTYLNEIKKFFFFN